MNLCNSEKISLNSEIKKLQTSSESTEYKVRTASIGKTNKRISKPELMAPAGDWTMLRTAVKAGADAVYFGVEKLNMRAKAANFNLDELHELTQYCRKHEVKTYLTLNTIVYEEELPLVEEIIVKAKNAQVDRIICWDLSVTQLCRKYNIPFCISTQGSVSNSLSALFYKQIGAERIVLARECSLEDIKKIRESTDLEIEAFIHGAMCIAVSGRCFMSHHLFGKSANRGECIQPCRREYEIYDPSIKKSMILGEDYVLSPNDLCTIEFIDKLIEVGIDSFKIEGRKRSAEYVARTVSSYRKAIDLYFEGRLNTKIKKELLTSLEEVYNRGFSSGFYFEVPSSNEYADIYGSKATTRKEFIGKVFNYYKKINVAHLRLETGKIKIGDKLLFIGPTTGVVEHTLEDMLLNEVQVKEAGKGDEITFKFEGDIRPRDSVYIVRKVKI